MTHNKNSKIRKQKTRILIVEDHEVFRMGIRALIDQEEDLTISCEADNADQAMEMIRAYQPDMAIIDLSLKDSNGIELIKGIFSEYKKFPILVVSMHDEMLYAERALRAGARGYLMKHESADSIVKAIRAILAGKKYVSENIIGDILNKITHQPDSASKTLFEKLTDREFEVFGLIGKGLSTEKIARQLFLSSKTIGTYRERLKEKLNLKNSAELARFAILQSNEII